MGNWVFASENDANPQKLDSLKLAKREWGWAIYLTNPGVVSTIHDLWMGAGNNDTKKGTQVGSVTVNWDGTEATVTYQVIGPYVITKADLYAQDTPPTKTAPGQYGNQKQSPDGVTKVTFTVPVTDTASDKDDGIWLIAHADIAKCKPAA